MSRNSYMLALKRFGAFALVGVIFVSLFATGIMARGSAEGAASLLRSLLQPQKSMRAIQLRGRYPARCLGRAVAAPLRRTMCSIR